MLPATESQRALARGSGPAGWTLGSFWQLLIGCRPLANNAFQGPIYKSFHLHSPGGLERLETAHGFVCDGQRGRLLASFPTSLSCCGACVPSGNFQGLVLVFGLFYTHTLHFFWLSEKGPHYVGPAGLNSLNNQSWPQRPACFCPECWG